MSKVDDLRAMREARYAASRAGATKPTAVKPTPAKPATAKTPTVPEAVAEPAPAPKAPRSAPPRVEKVEAVPEPATAGLCGHRNMSGRTCTRELGHAAKSHRYS